MWIAAIANDGYQGGGLCAFFGLMLGLFGWMTVSGLMGMAGRVLPLAGRAGIVVVALLSAVLAGPSWSAAGKRQLEVEQWDIAVKGGTPSHWQNYDAKLPDQFQRKEFLPTYWLCVVEDGGKKKDVKAIRNVVARIIKEHPQDSAFQPAREAAARQLKGLYAEALRSNATAKGDPALRKTFQFLLDDLAESEDGVVYVDFHSDADLKEPAGSAALLERMRRSVPKGTPVIEPGEAFSKSFDKKRRDEFLKVSREGFKQVFSQEGLFDLKEVANQDDAKGKLLFRVESKIERIPTYYENTRSGKLQGLLFGFQVKWSFSVIDRSGKELYSHDLSSEPAKELRFKVRSSDPSWAPYSIMMDSAYSNYARQTVARFGIAPPAEQKYFEFTR